MRLLLEIGTEELPASFIPPVLTQLEQAMAEALTARRLDHGPIRALGSPRRLAVVVESLSARQADAVREVRGPARIACFDAEGHPTSALLGFCRAQGITPEDAEFRETPKGPFAFAILPTPGCAAEEVLPEILPNVVLAPTFPKTMRWAHRRVRYGRPIRWLLALLGDKPISFAIEDIESGRCTSGHRVLGERWVELPAAEAYEGVLRAQFVMVDPDERREAIRRQVQALAEEVGGEPVWEELEENVFLAEWPTALRGSFDERFLQLPEPVLLAVLQHQQKYFPIRHQASGIGHLTAHFIAIRDGDERGIEKVRQGNETVVHGRLEDAAFYYDRDLARPLDERLDDLRNVVFMAGLGSVWEKTQRLEKLVDCLSSLVDPLPTADDRRQTTDKRLGTRDDRPKSKIQNLKSKIRRAAQLCKADLTTLMVQGFPELQGIMGGVYAGESGEPEEVVRAIEEHYLPRRANDPLPETLPGQILSLADKMDTVVGCLSAGTAPTGSQDPLGLRQLVQGMARVVIEGSLPVDLPAFAQVAMDMLGVPVESRQRIANTFSELLLQRAHAALETLWPPHYLEAVLPGRLHRLHDVLPRLEAIEGAEERDEEQVEAAARVTRRLINITKGYEGDAIPDPDLFEHDSEEALYQVVCRLREELPVSAPNSEFRTPKPEFGRVIELLSAGAPVVDRFFKDVLVNVDDERIRNNRLALCRAGADLYTADFDLSALYPSEVLGI